MIFKNKLYPATLIKRYKRFLADVLLADESVTTVYCPNTGSMKSCSAPGSSVYISRSDNLARKYPFTLEMIQQDSTWIGINTGLTNHIVADAIEKGEIAEFSDIDSLRQEVKVSKSSRLDLLLTKGEEKIYIEIKNCSLVEDGVAMFPDAVTARGTKHLRELAELVHNGHEAVIFFLVQRTDAKTFRAAAHIDPVYADVLAEVHAAGVRVLVYQAEVTPQSIQVKQQLPYSIA